MPDDREPYAQLAHGIYKDWHAEQPGPKVNYWPWVTADPAWRELLMRIGSAVAAQAVADAGLANERMRMQLAVFAAHLPAIRAALTVAIADATYEAEAKPYRAALKALEGSEEGGRDA